MKNRFSNWKKIYRYFQRFSRDINIFCLSKKNQIYDIIAINCSTKNFESKLKKSYYLIIEPEKDKFQINVINNPDDEREGGHNSIGHG